jgi:DNA gyrase subunit B
VVSLGVLAMSDYTAHDIVVLEGLEHVRVRPAMYIGSTDADGVHRLLVEALGGPLEEALEGHATRVQVRLGRDGSVSVEDDGEGVGVTPHPRAGKSPLEHSLMSFGACRCGCALAPGHVRRRDHGLGPQVINALSSSLEAETAVDGQRWRLGSARGRATSPLEALGPTTERGMRLTFTPDPEIFGSAGLDVERVVAELRWHSALTPEVTWELLDERTPRRRLVLRSARGLADLVQAVAEGPALARPLSTRSWGTAEGLRVTVALTRQAGQATRVLGFLDAAAFAQGDHVSGLLEGLREGFAEALGAASVPGRWPLPGLVAAVAVVVPDSLLGWERGGDPRSEQVHELVRRTARGLVASWARANPALFRAVFA